MAESVVSRLRHAWNIFWDKNALGYNNKDLGYGSTYDPTIVRLRRGNERSIIAAIYNRISIDVAAIEIRHVRLDDEGEYKETIYSSLNDILNVSANIDQTGRSFLQDAVMSMLDEGVVALVPIKTDIDPTTSGSYSMESVRTGKILEWYPKHIRCRVYNEEIGQQQDITVSKDLCCIVENPFYAVMNEPNSTLQRLIRKLNILDAVDEQSGSGKLDLIIQLPYLVRSPERQKQAEKRRADLEQQLAGSKYGVAYTDGTEKVVQLNRAAENNLMKSIEYLTSMLYSQLGMTETIFDGTADEQTMLNYFNRTVEPCLSAFTDEMYRRWITKTGRTQKQSIMFFRDPFKLAPVEQIANIADKFTRNAILSSNEMRAIIGYKPVNTKDANELRNKNLNPPTEENPTKQDSSENTEKNNGKE